MQMIADAKAPGPITGSGTGYKRAVRMFEQRQKHTMKVGRWRCGTNNKQYKEDGFYIDPDYYLVDWSPVERSDIGINLVEECNARAY